MKAKLFLIFSFFQLLLLPEVMAQGVPQGINYQGILRDGAGSLIFAQNISVRFSITSVSQSGTLVWEETQNTSTNSFGLFNLVIGSGISTGAGSESSFANINWGQSTHFIRIGVDVSGGSSYVNIDTLQFWAVPYAFYASKAENLINPLSLNDLSDVNISGVINGQALIWNGTEWIPGNINACDTVLFAWNSNYASNADSANVATYLLNIPDTVNYSNSAQNSVNAQNSIYADSSLWADDADTANFAWNCFNVSPGWSLTGNAGTNPATHFLGTTDITDLSIRTNATEALRITSNGRIGIGTATPLADFHLVNSKGILASGQFGAGATLPVTGAGTRLLWFPEMAVFRAGTVTGTHWDLTNTGTYSFASGYNNIAKGNFSFATGQQNQANGDNSAALGFANIASGYSSFAVGSSNSASGVNSVSLGRGGIATDSSSTTIGYHCNAFGKFTLAFGYQTTASGDYSLSMGYNSSTAGRRGSFVFADASVAAATTNTADNQFMIRASGGYVLYSNSALTSGVTLAAGGGSWASLSDRNCKTHIRKVNGKDILKSCSNLQVYSWNYKSQDSSIRHIGPMAQDFYQAFQLGENNTTISIVDIDGVNMAAIQELEKKTADLSEKEKEIIELKERLRAAEQKNLQLEKRIVAIEKTILKEGELVKK